MEDWTKISRDTLPEPLGASFDHHVLRGVEETSETALYHPPSETLFITDIGFNMQEVSGLWSKFVMWFNGGWGDYELTFIGRQAIDDTDAFLHSIDTILEWPFTRIWLPHGTLIDTHAHDRFHDAYERLRG